MSHSTNDYVVQRLLDAGRIVVDFETGEIFNLRSSRTKPIGIQGKKGYLRTNFWIDGNQRSVFNHRIVWIAAHGVPANCHIEIDHINGIKNDNRLENLEAVLPVVNVSRAIRCGVWNGGWRNAPRGPKGHFLPKPKT